MKKNDYLKAILLVSVAGMLFSGYLSYAELFTSGSGCAIAASKLIGIPTCVYGFFMYLLVGILSGLGLKASK